jgi:hypothetical protein
LCNSFIPAPPLFSSPHSPQWRLDYTHARSTLGAFVTQTVGRKKFIWRPDSLSLYLFLFLCLSFSLSSSFTIANVFFPFFFFCFLLFCLLPHSMSFDDTRTKLHSETDLTLVSYHDDTNIITSLIDLDVSKRQARSMYGVMSARNNLF